MAVVKVNTWVDLACRLGVVEDTPFARKSYMSWINRDAAGAQRAVCAAMPRPRAAAAPVYPLSWASSVRAAQGRPTQRQTAPAERGYPANWLPRVSARSGRSRITEAND